MAFDPEELVTLTDHGTMKLRSAVARAMILPLDERKRVTIVRKGKPAALKFERIKDLAAEWAKQLVPSEQARAFKTPLGSPYQSKPLTHITVMVGKNSKRRLSQCR